jgi:uncharacterized protein (DUF1800 family)
VNVRFAAFVSLVICPLVGAEPLATSNTWNSQMAAHLLRRAGFGGTPQQIEYLTKLGRTGAVDYLLKFESAPAELKLAEAGEMPLRPRKAAMSPEEAKQTFAQRRLADTQQLQRVLDWWLAEMVSTGSPLREKLVLFWHGHFTSGYREVKSSRLMYAQNQLFRKNAAGSFRQLLLDITEDPAMVLYLNTQQNRKNKPNENYARELMELFTMGKGHYSEQDIKESARAFTGIAVDPETGKAVFRRGQHDFGEKTFLGQRGKFGATEIIDIILKQDATAEYLATKLWTFFAYEDPDESIVHALAQSLRENKYELRPVLRQMFTCDAFYGERALFTHIKSPVELLVGTYRSLEIEPRDTAAMNFMLRNMGQQHMQPPNVKGWDGGAAWITTSTLLNRYNFMSNILDGSDNENVRKERQRLRQKLAETFGAEAPLAGDNVSETFQPAYDCLALIKAARLRSAEATTDYFVRRLIQRPIDRKSTRLNSSHTT